jgi:hypothetical protein
MLLFLTRLGIMNAAGTRINAAAILPVFPIGRMKIKRRAAKTAEAEIRRVILSVIVAPPIIALYSYKIQIQKNN